MRLTPKKGRGVGTYLMIGVLLVAALIFLLPNLKGSSKEPEYSEIIQYFDDYEVTEYTLDLGSGELKMVLEDGKKITYDVPNVAVFRDDTKNYRTNYNRKHPDAPLKLDYYKIRLPDSFLHCACRESGYPAWQPPEFPFRFPYNKACRLPGGRCPVPDVPSGKKLTEYPVPCRAGSR